MSISSVMSDPRGIMITVIMMIMVMTMVDDMVHRLVCDHFERRSLGLGCVRPTFAPI